MLHLRRILCYILLMLLLAQPVLAASEPATEPEPIVAMYPVEAIPADTSGVGAPAWLRELISVPLYTMAEDETFRGVLASGLPEDVTAQYAGTFGIPADAVRGYAFRITLDPAACREDGTPVTADDCIASIHTLFENEKTAEDWLFLANAEAISSERPQPGDEVISLQEAGFSTIRDAWEAGFRDFFVDITHFWGLPGGWRSVSDGKRIHDDAMPGGLDEYFISPAYLYHNYLLSGASGDRAKGEFVGIYRTPGKPLTTKDLGLVKISDRELVLITAQSTTVSTLVQRLQSFTLVDSRSCGPYRISAASGEALLLEKNLTWWGAPDVQDYDYIYCQKIGT